MKKYLSLLKYVKSYRKYYILTIILVIINTVLSLPLPLVVRYIIDEVIAGKNIPLLNLILTGLIILYLFRALISYMLSYLYGYIGQNVTLDIRKKLFNHMQEIPISYIDKNPSGTIVSRIMNDVGALNTILTDTFISIITQLLTLVIILVILLILNWRLTLINLLVLPIFSYLMRFFNIKIRKISRTIQDQSAIIMSSLYENITNQKLIRAYNVEKYISANMIEKLKTLIQYRMKSIKLNSLANQISFVLVAGGPLFVLWYGSNLVIKGVMSLGSIIAFYQYLQQVYAPIQGLANINLQLQRAYGAVDRINEFLDIIVEEEVIENIDSVTDFSIKSIKFDDVSFSYGQEKILKNISFEIQMGEFVGIVGPSGSGKTTIINLLMKFYKQYSGKIYFSGIDINRLPSKLIRERIGIVTQEPFLFHATIKENIMLGKMDASFKEVREAAKLAQIDQFIMSLPNQYETIVGERGVNLSGGQKQRICLARAFLRKPELLILDEATSSLDSQLENLIQAALENTLKDMTYIVVAHRLSTIKKADKIIVIDKGEIVEIGNHEELLINKGLYYRLYNEQYKEVKKKEGW